MKLLITDWEGTLVDFQWKLKASISEMCEIIKGYNINYNLNLPIAKLKKLNYSKLYNYFQNKKNIEDPLLQKKIIADFDRIYDFYDEDAANRWKLKENVIYVFKKLAEQNVKVALCSNVGRKALDSVLTKMKLKIFFDITVSRDDVTFLKPKTEGIKKILQYFKIKNINENEIFFLGDSITDILTARAANIPSVIITDQSENSFNEIVKHSPTHIINNIKNVLMFFHN